MRTISDLNLRRHFYLPEEDIEHLDAFDLPWETLSEQGIQWLIVHNLPVPLGYNREHVAIAVRITPGYPTAPLDMAYFSPFLARKDGRPIRATSARQQLDGRSWQRWSRHRTSQNPWRPGVDCIATHLALVEHWLEREFR